MAIKSSDQLTVVDLTDGVSVILTNDSHTFPGGVSAALASSTTTTVIAMRGTEQIPASVSNASIVSPTGVTTSVDTDPTQPTITINVSTAVTAGGTVDIPVSLDNGNLTIHKLFTFQIAFKGTGGDSAQWYSGTGITGTSTTATIFSGSGITAAKVGDMYLNTDTMNTYRCTVAGAASVAKWVYVGNIKGDQGATGAGAVWYTGTAITGTSTTGTIFSGSGITDAKVGDMYLNTSTYNTYRCTVAGAASVAKWVYVNNIKGVQGDTGPAGKGVQSTTRYYILQSTTPVKPAVKPPGGNWVTTEPSYTTGSTNSLYFTDLTVFSDGSFAYSDVSLSSSYEAAKAAFNEAVTAEAAAAEAAKIATNYLSYNSSTGLDVSYTGTNAKTRIKGSGVEVFGGSGDSAAFFGTSNGYPISRIGDEVGAHVRVESTGLKIRDGALELAKFTSTNTIIGQTNTSHISIASNSISANDSAQRPYWSVQDFGNEVIEFTHEYKYKEMYLYRPTSVISITVDDVDIDETNYKYSICGSYEGSFDPSADPVPGEDQYLWFWADEYDPDDPERDRYPAPDYGATIVVRISTNRATPAFTFFSRLNGSDYGIGSFASGLEVCASGLFSHAEGQSVSAIGTSSHAEGKLTEAIGENSHAEGYHTSAVGNNSHACGRFADATGDASCAEGVGTTASGQGSHAEGHSSTASGSAAHAEGYSTTATSQGAHAEGMGATASNQASHAEGYQTAANGRYSHAQNNGTIATKESQTVLGTYNIQDTSTTTTHPSGRTTYGQYAVIVGNGEYGAPRSNALTVGWDGTLRAYGKYQDAAGATIFQRNKGSNNTEYPVFWDNQYILRLATKTTNKSPASANGTSFIIANGLYAAGSVDDPPSITSDHIYLAGGCDSTSRWISSPAINKRTYNAAANVYVTTNGYLGKSTSSSVRYKHDIEYLTNEDSFLLPRCGTGDM